MTKLWVVVMTVGLAACGGKGNKDVDQLKSWADEMCACKERQCVEKVMETMSKAAQDDKRPMSERQMDEGDMKAFGEQSKRLTDCSMKASGMK